MKNKSLRKLILSAMLLAVGMVLPTLTMQIKEIGDTLLPMHLPVMLCGLICGPWHGLLVGLMLPFLRSVTFGMPPIYPNAVWMSLELAAYGCVIGIVYMLFKKKNTASVCVSLVTAMLAGRIVWGIAKAILLGLGEKPFTFAAFITGGFVDALPGIVLQLILIPLIMKALEKAYLIKGERQ